MFNFKGEDDIKKSAFLRTIVVMAVLSAFALVAAPCQAGSIEPRAQERALFPQRIRSYSQLAKLLTQHQPRYYGRFRIGALPPVDAATAGAAATGGSAASFSGTIVQVAGVDEGDRVKNDGAYIYQINQNRVLIVRAYPHTDLGLAATLDFRGSGFSPRELYLDGNQLVVIGAASHEPAVPGGAPRWLRRGMEIQYFSMDTLQAKVYDVTTPSLPRKVREIEIEGDYVATRKIGSSLYLLSRRYPDFYALRSIGPAGSRSSVPSFRDSRRSRSFSRLRAADCYYFPGFDDPNYLIVAGVDLSKPDSALNITAYLGAGAEIYASQKNLYVTASRYLDRFLMESSGLSVLPTPPVNIVTTMETTDIYKFSLIDSKPVFVAGTRIDGTILNSYSMDEQGDYLRVAATLRTNWSDASGRSNSVYVLDAALNVAGRLNDIAAGEQVYAARFMGNRLFLVTYEQIDPLFAIDLTDPAAPVILGQLTLPGYSNFLIPYDENHLIGLGKDVIVADGGTEGDVPWWAGGAFYQGMKIALFDVTDLGNPVLMDSVSIGDRGTESPVLRDPHALLFDPAKNLLGFPINVAELADPDETQPWLWGDARFQGAYIYNVSLDAGFVLQAAITHIPPEDSISFSWDKWVDRLLYIGSDLYTLSQSEIRVNDLTTFEEKTSLSLP